MAEANISVAPNHFICPVCMEILKDPVTVPCGHNYCMKCIISCWNQQEEDGLSCSCPQCRRTFTPKPEVGRNLILAEMVAKIRTTDTAAASPPEEDKLGLEEVACTVCVGNKRKADKSCLECLSSYCETHFIGHEQLHTGKRHKVVEPVAQLERRVCSDHDKPLEVWCQQDQGCICPLCLAEGHKGHDVITAAQAKVKKKSELSSCFKEELDQREKQLVLLQEVPEPLKHSARKVVDASEKMFTELMSLVEKRRCEITKLISAQAQDQLRQVRELESGCRQRIVELKRRDAELNQLSQTDDDIHFLLNMPSQSSRGFHMFNIVPHAKFGAVETFISNLSERVTDILNKEFDAVETHDYCQLKLDIFTAFRHHKMNDDRTSIEWSHSVVSRNNYNDNSRQVLCTQVGVYLDHDAGVLAFLGVINKNTTLIHKVQTTFTQPLYPGFYVTSSTTLKIH
ncbi:E3 ubiquitin-protein ligase TRIM47-like [Lampris incognitus]|uniref:E3 ubiquitin-protein ligase TRIM47-like n=1 Tax=Lampris incognitus TaxID=2546036 RepID=UPI0024B52818|nr:E3 ubiquitin-protein ligase TRIM47-like [Lampris incognitus]